MTPRMIADELGIPLETVNSLLQRIVAVHGVVRIKGLGRTLRSLVLDDS
jgi:hypothetical protein